MTDTRIVVVGSANVDLVTYAERLPGPGETVLGSSFLQGFGGKGANQAVMAARFGVAVAFVGAVGDDPNGAAILANLRAEGIATDDVAIVEGPSGVAPIWVDGAGMNRIIVVAGANGLVSAHAAAAAVERLRPAVVVGQLEIPQATTAAAFAAARRVGAVTILNPAPAAALAPELIAATDWLVPNETELVALAADRHLPGGPAATDDVMIATVGDRLDTGLVVTLGARGAALRLRDGGSIVRVAAPVAEAIDTTGAGDVFVGAFAVGLAAGLDAEKAAHLACGVASDSVTRPGAQSSFADRASAAAMLADVL